MNYQETSLALTKTDWEDICPFDEYRIVSPAQLPAIFPGPLAEGLTKYLVANTGNSDISLFIVQTYKQNKDKGTEEIGSLQYISIHNKQNSTSFEGFTEQTFYPNRPFSAAFISGTFAQETATINLIFPFSVPISGGTLENLKKLRLNKSVEFSYSFSFAEDISRNVILSVPKS